METFATNRIVCQNTLNAIDTSKTYWNGQGELQAEYDVLFKLLVPRTGEAQTDEGAALRAISKIYYDLYNNGGGNLADCDENGERVSLDSYAENLIRQIRRVCSSFTNSDRLMIENMITSDERIADWQWVELERITTMVIRSVVLTRLHRA